MVEVAALKKGSVYPSFNALSLAVKEWETSNFVSLYVRSSRSVEAARKRVPNRYFNPQLKYSEIDYACIHGGRKAKSTSKGQRPNQSTFLKDCPFIIMIRATVDGQQLLVKEMSAVECHSHQISKQTFQFLPKQRRLSISESAHVGEMLSLKANKYLIQQHIQCSSGKSVQLKDLHNLASRQRTHNRNEFEELVNEMKKMKGAIVDVFIDETDTLQAIYFQTAEMRDTFEAYPELLLIDATYKLNDLRMPLHVLMNVDGNGESEIICLWLVSTEDKATISSLMDKFKEHNSKWGEIGVIMADKDMTERDVLTEKLPEASILICLFHTLRSFRREVSTEKLGISIAERNMCLEILGKMASAKTEEEYKLLHGELTRSAPRPVVTYFNNNWHDIRQQWVHGFKNTRANFLNMTNNRLESTNQKLKMVVTRYSGLRVFFDDLMSCIATLKNERDHRAVNVTTKVRVTQSNVDGPERQYHKLLTPYAFGYVKDQLNYCASSGQ